MKLSETSKTVASATLVVVNGVEAPSGFPLVAPAGSVAAPSYSFSGDSGAGLYSTSAGDMVMGVDKVASWAVSPDKNVTLAGAPPSSYGGGSGVNYIPQVSTAPSGVPNGGSGGVLYISGNVLHFTDSLGVDTDLTSLSGDLNGPGASTDGRAALFSGTSGEVIKDSTLFLDTSGANPVISVDASNTPGAPRYSFASDSTVGMYTPGANSLGFSTGGVQRLQVNVGSLVFSTPVSLPSGSVSSPALRFPDGGLYSSGGAVLFSNDNITPLGVTPGPNVCIGGGAPPNYGSTVSGQGVTLLHQVTTPPSAATTGGISLYTDGAAVKGMTTSGSVIDLSTCLEGAASSTDTAPARFDGTTGDLLKDTPLMLIANSGEVATADGTAALPAYSFSGDTGTGMYRVTDDTLGFSTLGVNRATLTSTDLTSTVRLLMKSGTPANPGLQIGGSVKTELSLNGASFSVSSDTSLCLYVSPERNVSVAGALASSYGGGEGVLFINQASTNPSTNPTGSGLIYVPSGDVEKLTYRDTAGTVTDLNSFLEGPASATDRGVAVWDGTTGRLIQDSPVTVSAAGNVSVPDGSVGSPSYTFLGDPDTGLFRSAADSFGISAGGSEIVSMTDSAVISSQPVRVPVGLVGAPSLSFSTDPDTGLFHPAADTISFVGGGAAGLTVTLPAAATNSSVTLCSGAVDYGAGTAGERVVKIDDVSVAPSGAASGGGRLYVSGTTLNYHDDLGGIVDLSNIVSGPVSSTLNAMLRWDGTSGELAKDSGVIVGGSGAFVEPPVGSVSAPTFSFTSATSDGLYFPASTSIAVATSGTDRVTVSSSAASASVAVHADAGLEVGGATGASYSLAGANFVSDIQNASGTFEWSNLSGPIFQTSGLNLSFSNNLVFTEGTETLTVGHDGTDFAFNSGGTSPLDMSISVGGTDVLTINLNKPIITGSVICDRCFVQSSSTSKSQYSFTFSALSNRGIALLGNNAFGLGLGASLGLSFNTHNNVSLTKELNDTFEETGGEGILLISASGSPPASTGADDMPIYVDETGVEGLGLVLAGPTRSLADGGRKRAVITVSTSPSASSSTNTDGLTWSVVDANEVNGTTTGRLSLDDDCFVGMTVNAEWASDSVGYRRVSIMRRTAGPTYTQLNSVSATAVNGTITAQTVSFFGSIDAATDELTVQVEQTSSGALSVDLHVSLVRYTTNEAI